MRGDSQTVRTLLDQGETRGRDDALRAAACKGRTEVAQLLLDRGVSAKGTIAWTPLHCAVDNEHPTMVSLLLNYGADPDYGLDGMITARMLAERKKNPTILAIFRNAKAAPAASLPPSPAPRPPMASSAPPPIY